MANHNDNNQKQRWDTMMTGNWDYSGLVWVSFFLRTNNGYR